MSPGGADVLAEPEEEVYEEGMGGALGSGSGEKLESSPAGADRATLSRRNSFISIVLAVVLDGSKLRAFCNELHASLL